MLSVIWKPPQNRNIDDTMDYFDRYDKNAPPRPELIKGQQEKIRDEDEILIEKGYMKKEKRVEVEDDAKLREFADGIANLIEKHKEEEKDPKKQEVVTPKRGQNTRKREKVLKSEREKAKDIAREAAKPEAKIIQKLKDKINKFIEK